MSLCSSSLVSLFSLALFGTACGSDATPAVAGATGTAAVMPRTHTGTDAGALADLQASAKWNQPRCRWLETSAHILFYPQDTEVLMAARNLGWVDVEQAGTGNRTGKVEPAWKVALTDAGKAESARCGRGSERSAVFGVPVSQRKFVSAKRVGEPDEFNPQTTTFEVEFEWVPTPAGDQVRLALTGHMAVEQGLATARVAMLYGPGVINRGSNGWAVQTIHDPRPTPRR